LSLTEYVLQDKFGLRDGNFLAAFQTNRGVIENMAEAMIRADPNLPSLCISTGNEDKLNNQQKGE